MGEIVARPVADRKPVRCYRWFSSPEYRMRLAIFATLALFVTITFAEAHPGALDANGCHRQRKTGRRLCHAGHIKPGEHRRFVGFDGVVRHFSH